MSKYAPTVVELEKLAEKWNMVAQHVVRQDPDRVKAGKAVMTDDVYGQLEEINRELRPLIAQAKEADALVADAQPESDAELAEFFDAVLLATETGEAEAERLDNLIAPIALRGQEIMAKVFAAALGDDFRRVAPAEVHSQAISDGFRALGHPTLAAAFAP